MIDCRIPLTYIGTFAVFVLLFGGHGFDINYLAAHLFGGGLMLGAWFMATDYVTTPITKKGQLVYGVCLKYLRNPDDAGDAVMDIFEELTVKVGRYEVERFRPWLYTLAKNHCLQRLRRKRLEIPADDAGRIMEYAPLVHLLDGEGDEARFAALERCLERLPEKQRECIDRFFYGGKSYADISAETCWPVKSIKSFLQNGKRNLKLCMEKEADETD